MNTVNQTFDWSRFTATLRKELVENKRGILFTIIGIYGLLTTLMILGNITTGIMGGEAFEEFGANTPKMFIGSIMSLVICVTASLAFRNLTSKTGRTYLLTSPSSTLEKFLVNVLIYVVGAIAAYLACAQLADLTRIAVLWGFRSDTFYVPGPINFLDGVGATKYNFDNISELSDFSRGIVIAMWISLFASAGVYMLGSVLWPRLSLLKTFAAFYALEICLFIIAAPLFYFFGDMESLSRWMLDFIMGGKFSTWMIIWTSIYALVAWSLAWYIFKHKDVVSLKWWK